MSSIIFSLRTTCYFICFMVKTWRQYCFPYIFGYFTMGKDVYIDFSQLRSIPPPKFFYGILYSSMSCILDLFKPTFFLISLMVKCFWKGTFSYILLWKLMLKSLYHTLGRGLPKSIFMQICGAQWALFFSLRTTFYLICFMVKTWRQYCFPYIFGYFTIEKDVQVDFSQLRSIPPPKLFDGILYCSMSCIFDFFKPTFFLICLMVKSFWKGTLPYILLWKLLLK